MVIWYNKKPLFDDPAELNTEIKNAFKLLFNMDMNSQKSFGLFTSMKGDLYLCCPRSLSNKINVYAKVCQFLIKYNFNLCANPTGEKLILLTGDASGIEL